MDKNKNKKKISIAEKVSILLIIVLYGGYFYWRIWGEALIDDPVPHWFDNQELAIKIFSLLVFGTLLVVSYFDVKKGKNFELFNFFLYGAIILIIIVSFVAGFI